MSRLAATIVTGMLLFALAGLPGAAHAEEEKQPDTKRTHSMRAETFKEIEKAQQATDKKDFATARSILDNMLKGNLTDYERATVWSLLAAVHYDRDDYPGAIAAFRQVLSQQDIPEGMRVQTLTNLAQLLLANEQYRDALDTLKQLRTLVETPSADVYALEGQAYYQLKDYKATVERLLEAMRIAREQKLQFKEVWLALLRAAYYELGDNAKAAKVLEVLVSLYPKKEYWVQLAGLYGLLNREKDQLAALEAAWEQNLLDREAEVMSLAQLMMVQGVPYKAWRVIEKGMKDGIVQEKFETLRLLAQAMALAQENEKQIPVLQKAAKLAKDGEIDLYLGQAWVGLTEWGKAADALTEAIRKGLKRPGSAYLLLGTARFNQGRFDQARDAFNKAKQREGSAQSAEQWLRYVESEERRRQYIAAAEAAGGE